MADSGVRRQEASRGSRAEFRTMVRYVGRFRQTGAAQEENNGRSPFVDPAVRYAETSTWTARIEAAQSTHDVVDLANEFIAGLEVGELAFLPQRCRPRPLVNAEELSSYALELHLCLPMLRLEAETSVRRIALVIGQCAHRLAILLAPPRYVARTSNKTRP